MRVIIFRKESRYEAHGSLPAFFEKYPQYLKYKSNIETYLSRKKEPYVNKKEGIFLIRLDVNRHSF
jgi:hypothetical protein